LPISVKGETAKTSWLRETDSIAAIFWVVLGSAISIWSSTFPFGTWEDIGPALLPLVCGLVLLFFGMVLLFQAWRRNQGDTMPHRPILPQGRAFTRVVLSLAGLLGSAVLFDFLGFNLTLFLLILFLMKTMQPLAWRVALFYAVVFTLGSYLLFYVLLKVTLPHGFLNF
jgi:putative tricarboxylic transport membrane protein